VHDEIDEIATRYGFPTWHTCGPALLPVALWCMEGPQTALLVDARKDGRPTDLLARVALTSLARYLGTDPATATTLWCEFGSAITAFGVEHLEAFACLCVSALSPQSTTALCMAHRAAGLRDGYKLAGRENASGRTTALHASELNRWRALHKEFRRNRGTYSSLNAAATELAKKHHLAESTVRKALRGKRLPKRAP